MGGACGTYGGKEKCQQGFCVKVNESDDLKDLDCMIILNSYFFYIYKTSYRNFNSRFSKLV
jgi:hypothetical protein